MLSNKTSSIPRSRADYTTRLKKLEEEKQLLILHRKEEIFNIIDRTNGLSIDNELLAGALTILKEIQCTKPQDLSDHLKEFEALIREKAPIFFRKRNKSGIPKE